MRSSGEEVVPEGETFCFVCILGGGLFIDTPFMAEIPFIPLLGMIIVEICNLGILCWDKVLALLIISTLEVRELRPVEVTEVILLVQSRKVNRADGKGMQSKTI